MGRWGSSDNDGLNRLPERPRNRKEEDDPFMAEIEKRGPVVQRAFRRFADAMIESGRGWLLDHEDVELAFGRWCHFNGIRLPDD
jgi:hypothetical protein